jgi:WD40 repeat protein
MIIKLKMKKILIILLLFTIEFNAQNPRLVLPTGHTRSINSVEFSPDSKYLITAANDGLAKLYEVSSGKELMVFEGHTKVVSSAYFSPDGNLILTESPDGTARLYQTKTGILLKIFNSDCYSDGHNFEFSTDGKYLLNSSYNSIPHLYDLKKLIEIKSIINKDSSNLARFSRDGRFIITSKFENLAEINIYNIYKNIHVNKIKFDKYVYLLDFEISENSKYLNVKIEEETTSEPHFKIFEIISGKKISNKYLGDSLIYFARFNLNSELYFIGKDSIFKLLDIKKSNLLCSYKYKTGDYEDIGDIDVSGKYLCIQERYLNDGKGPTIYDLKKDKNIFYIEESKNDENPKCIFSPNGKKILIENRNNFKICNINNYSDSIIFKNIARENYVNNITENIFLISNCKDQVDMTYNEEIYYNGQMLNIYSGKNVEELKLNFLINEIRDENFLLFASETDTNVDSNYFLKTYQILERKTNKIKKLKIFSRNKTEIISEDVSQEGNHLAILFSNGDACLYDVNTGLKIIEYPQIKLNSFSYFLNKTIKFRTTNSSDTNIGKQIIIGRKDGSFSIFETFTGKLLNNFEKTHQLWGNVKYSEDGKYIINIERNNAVAFSSVYDAKTYVKLITINGIVICNKSEKIIMENIHRLYLLNPIINDSINLKEIIYEIDSNYYFSQGRYSFSSRSKPNITVQLSNNLKYLIITYVKGVISIIDVNTGKELKKLIGHHDVINSIEFTSDYKYIVSSSVDNKIIVWDFKTGKALYTRINLSNNDYLVYDEYYRYDGTLNAINQLYFACGLEIVELSQLKDSLYIPNLVQRIMNGESLNHLPKLENLKICGVTPIVEPMNKNKKGNLYKITPRTGGLGDIEIYINGILRETVTEKELKKEKEYYTLLVSNNLIKKFVSKTDSIEINVIAKTKNNSINSRSISQYSFKKVEDKHLKPNLYAIVIGIDDYKGVGIDLKYAAKDAQDFQTVLEISAKKYFNYDDTNRVHFYTHTLDRDGKIRGITPDRNNILNTIEKIKNDSKPQDIVLIFFAGHGELTEKNQLVLLTSEASKEQSPNFSGIAIQELLKKLSEIPAGKRILILDACHSGSAINELGLNSIAGLRDSEDADKKSQRIKELEKLSSKSGLTIITASNSEQKAIELPQFEHGLMTYALLSTMINELKVLDGNNQLQLLDWFRETQKTVAKLKNNQTVECFLPLNFTIGKIDDEVKKSIVIREIPTVAVANVINLDYGIDNLKIKEKIKEYLKSNLSEISNNKILYLDAEIQNSINLNVIYSIKGESLILKIIISKDLEIILEKEISNKNSEDGIKKIIEVIITELFESINKN